MALGGLRWRAALGSPVTAALAALVLYLPSLGHGFVRDDVPLIVENAALRAPGGLARLVGGDFMAATGFTSGLWRPLPLVTFWIDGRLGGWTPFLFHLVNVVLHAGATLALGLLLARAGVPRGAAALGALWFAAMPAHVEPVAWISGRIDLLCAGLALLSLLLDRRARQAGRAWPGWGALTAFAGALLSKEAAAGWAAVVVVAERARGTSPATARVGLLRWLSPYLAITAVWLALHAAASGPGELPGYVDTALRARRQAAGALVLPQLLAFLWPWYPHASDVRIAPPAAVLSAPVLAGAVVTAASVLLAVVLAVRRSPWAVPWAVLLVPVLPSLTAALARGYPVAGERLVYLPSAGSAWLLALGLARAPAGWTRTVGWGAAAALVLASAVETARLVPRWRNDEVVFRTMTERHPDDPLGWIGLAGTLGESGRLDQADAALARAEQLAPRLPAVHVGRAELHYAAGAWERVLDDAGQALALDPHAYRARLLRASTLVRLGRTPEAAEDVTWLLRDRPGDPGALTIEGQRLLAERRPAEAVAPLTAAARARPDDPALWFALGTAQAGSGDRVGARRSLEHLAVLAPSVPAVWERLAAVCAALGDSAAAERATARARALGTGTGR